MKNEENDENLVVKDEEDKEVDATSGKLKLIQAIIYIGFIISIVLVVGGIVKYFLMDPDSEPEKEPEPAPGPDPKDSEIFQKTYEKMETISKRDNIEVYKGKNKNTSEIVTIKEIQMTSSIKKEDIEKEVEYMELFKNNTHSIKFIEKIEENNITYIVFESYDAALKKYLNESQTGFNLEEIKIVMNHLNSILTELRKNKMVHNDIKLENILVKFTNSSYFDIKLSEYGKAKTLTSDKDFDAEKGDLLSLGKCIYEMLSKNKDKSIEEMRNTIKNVTDNSELEDLLNKTLVEKPDERINWDEYFKHDFFNNTIDYSQVKNIVKK